MIPILDANSSVTETFSACSEWGVFYFPFKSEDCTGKLFDYEHPAPIIKGGLKRGYLGYGMESGSSLFEAKEGFSYGMELQECSNKLQGTNVWPKAFPLELKVSLMKLFSDLCTCSLDILNVISLSLGKDENHLRKYCAQGDSISICRVFNYLSMQEAVQRFPGHDKYAGSSEHTDWGFITLIIAKEQQLGLQVQKDGKWYDVPGKKDYVIVNVGDYLSSLTRGMYKSPLHRVVLDHEKKRLSTVFFFYPDYSARIPSLVDDKWGSEEEISDICFGDLLYENGMRFQEMVIRLYSTRRELLEILGLPLTATKKEIKTRYFELAQKHHPDKTRLKANDFLKIKNAYEILVQNKGDEFEASKRKSSQSDRDTNDNQNFESWKILKPSMLYGIGFATITILGFALSLAESRSQAVNDAWEEYKKQRREDGLDTVLGYNDKNKS